MTFSLGEDGTLETLLMCNTCGGIERYTYEGCEVQAHEDNPVGCMCYPQFVTWAKDDAKDYHECNA